VKGKVILAVLGAIGVLALSTPAAHAGAGGSPLPLTSFFVCHGINADAPSPQTAVDVDSSVFLTNPQGVKIGSGVLACVVAKLFPAGSTHVPCPGTDCNEINPTPVNNSTIQEGVKCYAVSGSRQPGALLGPGPNTFTATDRLFGVDPDVQVNQFQYICGPANFNNPTPK
jgi:hypothetical protein